MRMPERSAADFLRGVKNRLNFILPADAREPSLGFSVK